MGGSSAIWTNDPATEKAFNKNLVALGQYLNSLSSETAKNVIVNQGNTLVNGLPFSAQIPMFIENTEFSKPRATYLLPENLNQIKIKQEPEKTFILLMEYDRDTLIQLMTSFPGGQLKPEQGFWIYEIPNY